jgi:hypothetical protein
MTIGAVSPTLATSYVRGSVGTDAVTGRVKQASRDSLETAGSQAWMEGSATGAGRSADIATSSKGAREMRDVQKADTTAASFSPRTQFKDSEGTQVMEFYDSKNVLIYQLPPKGLLTLIHSHENKPSPQILTVA